MRISSKWSAFFLLATGAFLVLAGSLPVPSFLLGDISEEIFVISNGSFLSYFVRILGIILLLMSGMYAEAYAGWKNETKRQELKEQSRNMPSYSYLRKNMPSYSEMKQILETSGIDMIEAETRLSRKLMEMKPEEIAKLTQEDIIQISGINKKDLENSFRRYLNGDLRYPHGDVPCNCSKCRAKRGEK